ncbi:hypothetical protein [Deinococcus apachensis]|uniref:hypothetical protein n=1 Tax=Deinococcus apachensis TaxID=309886 RepID=UPI0003A0DB6C|nr:hypothetical protein [Deinococcus apachensis]
MPESTLPPLKGVAILDVAPFRKGAQDIQTDLRAIRDLAKQVGTLKITADLSAGRDVQRQVRAIRDAVQELVPSDMQRRISDMFGGFQLGANAAKQSASAFEAQAAAIRARLNELANGVRLTRAEFQSGVGTPSPEELQQLTLQMNRLQAELKGTGRQARETFGEFSNEAVKAANATRLAVATVEAAHDRLPRLGLGSQVKLGVSQAFAEYGPQLGLMTNRLVGLAKGFETSRVQSVLFEKTLQKNGEQVAQVRDELEGLAARYNALPQDIEATYKALRRSGYETDQAKKAIELYAAIATVRGQDVGQALDALATDVERSSTILSNALGISTDQIASQEKYAQSLGKTRDELTGAQKAQAFLNALMREEGDSLTQARDALEGYGGAAGQLGKEVREAQRSLGEALLPAVLNTTRALTGFLDWYNNAPGPIKVVTTVLIASAAAIGLLSVPIASVATLYGTLTASAGTAAAAETAVAAATTRTNVAMTIKRVLMTDVGVLYAKLNAQALLYQGSMASSAAATNTLTGSLAALGTTLKTVAASISIYTVAATAALALGVYWANSVKETTAIYEQVDQANQQAFEKVMARVKTLRGEGELGRAKAKVLLLSQSLSDAQQGPLVGVTAFGERIYSKPDEARIQRLQADLAAARQNVTLLYTEAQRRGQLNLKLTEDQTKAVKELRQALEGKAFDIKLEGMSDLQADLARLGKEYEDLRVQFKKPFTVNGKLLDPAQTPALRDGLSQLDAQQAAAEASTRKTYADDAAKTAREFALATQRAEIEAMVEGQAKRRALRAQDLADLRRETAEKVAALADFPARQRQVEADGRRQVVALRRRWGQEDLQLARDNAQRVAEAEKSARDASISAMAEGAAKEEAQRRAALADLRASIAERVRALAGDPTRQGQVSAAGGREVAALERQQQRERQQALERAGLSVAEAERAARDATIQAMADGYAKEEALRRAALEDLRRDIEQRVEALAGYPDAQARVIQAGNRQIAALYVQQQQERRRAQQEAGNTALDAERQARDATIAAITDETARRRAARQAELSDLQESTRRRLESLRDFPAEQARVLEAARQQARAKQRGWDAEDERDARARTQRIVQAFREAQDAQSQAEVAGRGNQSAQYELGLSRRLAAAKGNAVEVALIEAQAVRERARLAEEGARAQAQTDRQRLENARDQALSADNLSAGERTAIWTKYYADLAALDGKNQADHKSRLQQQEEAERQAAENLRRARVEVAQQPATDSERRVGRLENEKGTTLTDAGLLALDQQISAERAKQLATLRGMLEPSARLNLTADERRGIEDQIAALQQAQLKSQQDQVEQARALRQSALDRLDAEAQYAERVAGTDAGRVRAQTQQLAITQARLSELDDLIAAEGREKERNDLIGQRFGLLGQIADLQDKINQAPFDAEQRRLDLYRAQAQAELALRGLGEDRVAQANLTAQVAARELLLANSRVAAARNELELQAALSGQAQARLALVQALTGQAQAGRAATREAEDRTVQSSASLREGTRAARDAARAQEDLTLARAQSRRESQRAAEDLELTRRQATVEATKRQLDLENALWDASEARARALTQIRGLADDTVTSAEQDLALTRERLALTERQLGTGNLGSETRADLQGTRVTLLGQEAEQERKLLEARRAQRDLAEELELAEGRLNRELTGGKLSGVAEATRKVTEARQGLTTAERAYAEARGDYERIPSSANAQRLKGATDALTGAIQGQRSAIHALADEYRTQISQMDGVREASDRLRQVAYGENQPFNSQTERQRLLAIQARRDAAQQALRDALASGDAAIIQKATEDLTRQEERYKKQADLLEKNGVKFTRTGEKETQRLADQVDALGIQYDREAVLLGVRARTTDREAEAALTFNTGVDRFADTTTQFVSALEGAYQGLQGALRDVAAERDREASQQSARREEEARLAAEDRARSDRRREEDARTAAEDRSVAAGDRARTARRQEEDLAPQPVRSVQDLDLAAQKLAGAAQPLSEAARRFQEVQATSRAIGEGLARVDRLLGHPGGIVLSPSVADDLNRLLRGSPAAPLPATQPVHTVYNTTDVGGITIYQQPGESADAVANRVITKLEDRARRSGRRC